VLGEIDERPVTERTADEIDRLSAHECATYGGLLSTAFHAGLRMGELRDLPRHAIDVAGKLIRVESNFTHGSRTTPKGKRARATPLVPLLAERLTAVLACSRFAGTGDYAFATPLGDRVNERKIRRVFYAALVRAGLGHKRAEVDQHGNPQEPIRVHDLRHSWCTWAVNVWPVTKVKEYAGHRDVKTTMRYVHHQTKAADADLGGEYLARALALAV
jgi:integrase